jgi:hypothetical protein
MLKIDMATCLVLDKRIDMGRKVVEQARQYDIDVNLFIAGDGYHDLTYDHIDSNDLPPRYQQSLSYPSWTNRPNAYNAWKSHTKIIHSALEKDAQTLLMLEDDVIFENDFADIVNNVSDFFNNNPWDMIYFGWYSHNHLQEIGQENICRMMGGGGFHGVMLNRYMMEELASVPPLGPYDYITGVFYHANINAYAIYPSVISQQSGYSYVEGGILEKPDRYKK